MARPLLGIAAAGRRETASAISQGVGAGGAPAVGLASLRLGGGAHQERACRLAGEGSRARARARARAGRRERTPVGTLKESGHFPSRDPQCTLRQPPPARRPLLVIVLRRDRACLICSSLGRACPLGVMERTHLALCCGACEQHLPSACFYARRACGRKGRP